MLVSTTGFTRRPKDIFKDFLMMLRITTGDENYSLFEGKL